MPADVLAVTLAVGERAHSKTKRERVEKVSGCILVENKAPARVCMAGQERRIDDTILIREAQRGTAPPSRNWCATTIRQFCGWRCT